MNFFDMVNISERNMELISPISREKIILIGEILKLKAESHVIDFGCGFGEMLAQWGEKFGISGVGIEIRESACDRARKKITERGLVDRFKIVCGKGAEYSFGKNQFDVAPCIGASIIWNGYQSTIRAIKEAIKPGGRIVIGEPYWSKGTVPPEFVQKIAATWKTTYTEIELLQITHQEGFDFEYMIRASQDERDQNEADNWHGLVRWLEENPQHPERQEVIDQLHRWQEEYFRYGREYLGWSIYVLRPKLDK